MKPLRCSRSCLGITALALAMAGCSVPNFEGPQVQNPPPGFLLQDDSYQNRRMFPDRDVTMHTAWIKAGNGPYSGIYVNAHPGDLTLEHVADAQEGARLAALHPDVSFGEIEKTVVDGRTAWGWAEKLESPKVGLDWVAYRTVVSYDTVSYAIEFYSGDPGMKLLAPDTLRAVISSFEVGQTEWNLPLIAMLGGLTILGVTVLRTRRKERAERLQGINLVQIPKEDQTGPQMVDLDGEEAEPVPVSVSMPPPPPPAAPSEMRHATSDAE